MTMKPLDRGLDVALLVEFADGQRKPFLLERQFKGCKSAVGVGASDRQKEACLAHVLRDRM